MEGCVLCGIAAGTVPARVVCRAADAVGFAPLPEDIVAPGHVVVAPIAHHDDLLDTSSTAVSAVMGLVQLVSRSCINGLGAQGVNVLHASGVAAGQSVQHLHFHVIPRWAKDGIDAWPSTPSRHEPGPDAYTTQATWIEGRQGPVDGEDRGTR